MHVADRKLEVRITNQHTSRSFQNLPNFYDVTNSAFFIFLRCELVENLDLAVSKVLACSTATVREAWRNRGLDH